MPLARSLLLLFIVSCASAPGPEPRHPAAGAGPAPTVDELLARPADRQDEAWSKLLDAAGRSAYAVQDMARADAAWRRVLEFRARTLPDDHLDLQKARLNLASTKQALGDLAGARALEEKAVLILARTRPEDDLLVQKARCNLASTLRILGDLQGARVQQEQALVVFERTLPDDDPDLQSVRTSLAQTLRALGDVARARELAEQALEVDLRTLRDDDPRLQAAREIVALTIKVEGDFARARVLEETIVAIQARTLPEDDLELQGSRQNLAVTIKALGDLAGARALEERVLAVRSRKLPDDHPDLQAARTNLAVTLKSLGDLAGARVLEEKVLEVFSRTLPDDHPDLQTVRGNLAATLRALGDLEGARGLQVILLEVSTRTLPEDHPALQSARDGLASTLRDLGELAEARALQEQVLEVDSRTLPDEDPDFQSARENLAVTLALQGDLAGARALQEKVWAIRSRTLPDDHPALQTARGNLAVTIASTAARDARVAEQDRGRCVDLVRAMCRSQTRAARAAILGSTAREAEERGASFGPCLDLALELALGTGALEPLHELEPECLLLSETTRGAPIVSAGFTRRAAGSPEYRARREALIAASAELARVARGGTTSAEFERVRTKRESAERDLADLARALSGWKTMSFEPDVDALAAALGEGDAAVAFRRFRAGNMGGVGGPHAVDHSCAFVVRGSKRAAGHEPAPARLTLVDLGPVERLADLVGAWRDEVGAGSGVRGVGVGARPGSSAGTPANIPARGAALRERLLDPLLPALAGAERLVVVLDDVLNLVPIDALPIDESTLVGDRWRVETRTTLTELLRTTEIGAGDGRLVAFGDVDYGVRDGGVQRGDADPNRFSRLPATGPEARGVARCFTDRFGVDAGLDLREQDDATREQLLALAPRARWLHIATHGWFAPDSIPSWSDPEPLDSKLGLGLRPSGRDQVKGLSPMLLCGLAFAGANLSEDAVGRVPGLVTADEIATLDLSGCELAVLSACDTNVGERRAGQGVASLQKALQMAGARSVITSLWKVPDDATNELMVEFYRRLWVERVPKHQALWEAKRKMRDARDASGRPVHAVRDWAAWVLTGDPD